MLSNLLLHRANFILLTAVLAVVACSSNVASSSSILPALSESESNQFWAQVDLDYKPHPSEKITVTNISMVHDDDIPSNVLSALVKQGEDQLGMFLTTGRMLESEEEYFPSLEIFKNTYPAFFDYKRLEGRFGVFNRFQQQKKWVLPNDFEAFYGQLKQSVSRIPFLQVPSRFMTFFSYDFSHENVDLEDIVITRSKDHEALYNITAIVKGKHGRYHALQNQSCYYDGQKCWTYLSWDYLGRVVDMDRGKLYTSFDLWKSQQIDK